MRCWEGLEAGWIVRANSWLSLTTKDPKICELLPESGQRAAHKMILVARPRYTLFRMYPVPVSPSFARGFFLRYAGCWIASPEWRVVWMVNDDDSYALSVVGGGPSRGGLYCPLARVKLESRVGQHLCMP